MTAGQDGFEFDANTSERAARDFVKFNAALARLRERRLNEITISGPLLKSRLAWLIATYQQPVLYRVVMLATGCAASWDTRNVLCAYLAARALIETVALVLEFDRELQELITEKNLDGIDALLMNRTFATRSEDLVKEFPDTQAKNILTVIQSLDKKTIPGVWEHYCFLSERCHPNSLGHHQLFGVRERETNVTKYSDWHHSEMHLDYVLAGAMLIELVEPCMDRLDAAILQVSELQHSVSPVVDSWT
ncbi:hypothetical protein SAMN05519103_05991 [Rhizobiales bacterium GAS113]|nr:hypothetical protein SAMN05519103_05991 [Rhizobiales bacterium GAS113]